MWSHDALLHTGRQTIRPVVSQRSAAEAQRSCPRDCAPRHNGRMAAAYDFTAALWEWDAKASWFFVTVPVEISDEIDARTHGLTNGFGSVRVRVRIGGSEWATSLFPDSKQQAYVLPIKKAVRVAEGIAPGDEARVRIELVDIS